MTVNRIAPSRSRARAPRSSARPVADRSAARRRGGRVRRAAGHESGAVSARKYNAIRSAITKVATAGGNSIRDYQVAFDRYAAIDDITSISGKDLRVEKRPDGHTVVSFEYEKRIPLFGPASLVIEYRGSAQ
ncbi:MAG: DUF4845 domain-containing protein [Burkholderiaceae bacterium]|nr:DUF4845 domain-containing protein [Burkholderiaceae bacterium]